MEDIRSQMAGVLCRSCRAPSKEIFGHVEKMIIGTLIVSAGAHVSSNEPAIVLFGYLRHGLVGRGVELFGVILLVLNFLDGLYKLAKAGLACRVSDRDVVLLRRVVRAVDPVDPGVSRRIARRPCTIGRPPVARTVYCAANWRQHVLAGRRHRGGLRRQALHDTAAAGRNAGAERANIGAAGRAQHEQFLARQHRPQHQDRRRRGGGRRRRSRSPPPWRAACGRRRRRWPRRPPARRSPKALPCSFPGISAPRRRRSARRRRPSDSRSGRRCGSRRPARCSAFLPPALRQPWRVVPAAASPLRQRGAALRFGAAAGRLRPSARPRARPRAPRSGRTTRGSTCSSAGIAANPRRRAGRWSNAP